MAIWYPTIGLILLAAGLAYAGLKTWQIGRRGWMDQRWIWSDANRGALLLAGSPIGAAVAGMLLQHQSDLVLFLICGGLILGCIPYLAYITGRLLGIRHRAQDSSRLY